MKDYINKKALIRIDLTCELTDFAHLSCLWCPLKAFHAFIKWIKKVKSNGLRFQHTIQLSPEGGGELLQKTETRSVQVYIQRYKPTLGGNIVVLLLIYQVSWIKIEKELFRTVNKDRPNFVSFLVFVGAAFSFTAKISSHSKLSRNEKPF